MIGRILQLVAGFAVAVLLITLAVANRHDVRLVLDPFNPQRPVISTELPFYAYLFATAIAGIVIGGMATWSTQGKWRKLARVRLQEMQRWRDQAERLTRERDAGVIEKRAADNGATARMSTDRKQLSLSQR